MGSSTSCWSIVNYVDRILTKKEGVFFIFYNIVTINISARVVGCSAHKSNLIHLKPFFLSKNRGNLYYTDTKRLPRRVLLRIAPVTVEYNDHTHTHTHAQTPECLYIYRNVCIQYLDSKSLRLYSMCQEIKTTSLVIQVYTLKAIQ